MARTELQRDDILDQIEIDERGCWVWQGNLNGSGYGQYGGGRLVHRRAYEIWIGPLPADGGRRVHVEHRCSNHACCNPLHLALDTNQMNLKYAWRRKHGQMSRRDLRVSRWLHERVSFI